MESYAWLGGVPMISMRRAYNNQDGKIDQFRFQIDLPGVDPQSVRNIQVLASFEYLLNQKLQIEMVGLAHFNIDTPNGAAKTIVDGVLRFD